MPLPDLFTAYPRVIPAMHDKLLHWDKYLDKEDLAVYQPEFLAEGYQDKELLMLPVAKSTELLFVNQTYFDRFAAATGASTEDFADYDKLFELCRKYYTWTGGKNMCQLDDFYNYYLTSMASLGDPLIKDGKPNLASPNFKRIFRAAAEPAIAGGLGIEKGYAADAWKTADLISNVGSTAAILYMRDYVTNPDNTRETIVTNYYPCPVFSGGKVTLLQRGVGLLAIKSTDERKNLGAVVFAKWLAQENSNLNFAMQAATCQPIRKHCPNCLIIRKMCITSTIASCIPACSRYTKKAPGCICRTRPPKFSRIWNTAAKTFCALPISNIYRKLPVVPTHSKRLIN